MGVPSSVCTLSAEKAMLPTNGKKKSLALRCHSGYKSHKPTLVSSKQVSNHHKVGCFIVLKSTTK